ncbi:MAG TPA: hypothetical protein VND93_09350 [Myxococcales bacterium]|nr:hypothetical protein [Myxococcales bacterium]
MSVLQLQTAMARLLASAEFREQVRKDGGESLRAYGLSELEHQELMSLLEGRLGLYAGCVSAGKEDYLLGNLPAVVTSRLPEPALRPALRRFIEKHPEATLHPRDEGLAFVLGWLEEDLDAPAHARDVLRYERRRRQVMAATARYGHPAGTPLPERLRRHPGWDADRFAYDVPAGAPGEVCWMFKGQSGGAAVTPCHPLLADVARAFDPPAEVASVVAKLTARHQADPHLGPDVEGAVREVIGELFAEGSLRSA